MTLHAFDQAIALNEESPGEYTGASSMAYWNFLGLFGGVTAATALNAVMRHPDLLGEPIALTVNYAAATGEGPYRVTAKPARTNRSTQHWTVQQSQLNKDGVEVVTMTATVVTAARRETWSASDSPMPEAVKPQDIQRAPWIGGLAWFEHFDLRLLHGSIPSAWDGGASDSTVTRLWVRDAPPRPLDFCSLAAKSDIFFPRLWLRRATRVPVGTVSITVYFHADGKQLAACGEGYVLAQARGQEYRNGFFDHSGQLWSEAGVLLATTHQIVYYKE